jgi:2-hydroxychromene-2-carboxylate isomerase
MTATIEAYYDFRSPYAYFANHRIRQGSFVPPVQMALATSID